MLNSRRRNPEAGKRHGGGVQEDPQWLLQQLLAVCAGQRGRRGSGSERQRPQPKPPQPPQPPQPPRRTTDVPAGPRTPYWGCQCGEAGNFACRLQCRSCGRHGPRSLGRPAGGVSPSVSARPAAAGLRPAPTPAPWASRAQTPSTVAEKEGTGDQKMTPPVAERLAGLRARIAALRPFPDFAGKIADLEAQVKGVMEEERSERPLPRRLQSAVDSLQEREKKSRRARTAADEAKKTAAATEAAAVQAEAEELAARQTLQRVEAEVVASGGPGHLAATLDGLTAECGSLLDSGVAGNAAALLEQLRGMLMPAAATATATAAAAAAAASQTGAASEPERPGKRARRADSEPPARGGRSRSRGRRQRENKNL